MGVGNELPRCAGRSEPCGVEGYKTLGYELAEEAAVTSADVILVSTASGDLLFGIAKGLIEAKQAGVFARLPRLVAVEPFVRVTRVLAAGIIAESSKEAHL